MSTIPRFAYPSLRAELERLDLALVVPPIRGVSGEEGERAWCSRLIGAMAWFSSQKQAQYVWRGHRDAAWPLQSRLNRHIAATFGAESKTEHVLDLERQILEYVRHQRWHMRQDGHYAALTLAATLQHRGVPTRLLDVTRDPLVAAFFAAQRGAGSDEEPDGAVIAIRAPRNNKVKADENGSPDATLQESLTFEPRSSSRALWTPPNVEPRIITQRGCFLVPNLTEITPIARKHNSPTAVIGVGIAKPAGTYTGKISRYFERFFDKPTPGRPPAKSVDVMMIVIPKERKETLRKYLESVGLTFNTIYPDLEGYAASFLPS